MTPDTPHIPDALLARAAALRAGGQSWEQVARKLDVPADHLRELAEVEHRPVYRRLLARARREAIEDAFADGLLSLRTQLRSDDDRPVGRAAGALFVRSEETRWGERTREGSARGGAGTPARTPEPSSPRPERQISARAVRCRSRSNLGERGASAPRVARTLPDAPTSLGGLTPPARRALRYSPQRAEGETPGLRPGLTCGSCRASPRPAHPTLARMAPSPLRSEMRVITGPRVPLACTCR